MEQCTTKIACGHFGSFHFIFLEGKYGLRRKYIRKEEGNRILQTPIYHSLSRKLFELTFILRRILGLYFIISLKLFMHIFCL